MSKEDLLTSINEYRNQVKNKTIFLYKQNTFWLKLFLFINQLTQVEATISSCTDKAQIDSLENLKNDLTELLDLTIEQLDELDSGQTADPFEDEMKLFLSEIRDAEQPDATDDNFQLKIEAIKVDMQ